MIGSWIRFFRNFFLEILFYSTNNLVYNYGTKNLISGIFRDRHDLKAFIKFEDPPTPVSHAFFSWMNTFL